MSMLLAGIGALCFGLVVGWISYRTLRRREGAAALSDNAAVISAIGGASVTALFRSEILFGLYAIGLAIGNKRYRRTKATAIPDPAYQTIRQLRAGSRNTSSAD